MENVLAPYRPQLLSIFRIMAGLLILQYGTAKIWDFRRFRRSRMWPPVSGQRGTPG